MRCILFVMSIIMGSPGHHSGNVGDWERSLLFPVKVVGVVFAELDFGGPSSTLEG